ncbi:MAG: helix-turn-helix domain-containing protein [Porticoccaceae bacterium]
MPAQWTGELVGKMHIHGITAIQLARKVGCHPKYLSAVLNGRREPSGAKERLWQAAEELIAQNETVHAGEGGAHDGTTQDPAGVL